MWQGRYHILLKISHIYLSYSQKPKVLLFILAKISSKFLKECDILDNDLHSSEPQFYYAFLYVYNWHASNTCLIWFNQLNPIVVPYIFLKILYSLSFGLEIIPLNYTF